MGVRAPPAAGRYPELYSPWINHRRPRRGVGRGPRRSRRGRDDRRHHYAGIHAMAMKTLEYLRGISAEDCRRLRARGIRHTNQLLHAVTLEIDRQRLSAKTGISPERLLEFGRQCAMLEISRIERYLPILRRLGVTRLKLLKRSDPAELHARIVDAVGLAVAPILQMVQYWVSQARTCDTLEEPDALPAQVESPNLLDRLPHPGRAG